MARAVAAAQAADGAGYRAAPEPGAAAAVLEALAAFSTA